MHGCLATEIRCWRHTMPEMTNPFACSGHSGPVSAGRVSLPCLRDRRSALDMAVKADSKTPNIAAAHKWVCKICIELQAHRPRPHTERRATISRDPPPEVLILPLRFREMVESHWHTALE